MLTVVMLRLENSEDKVSTMAVDAWVAFVSRSSSAMVLLMYDIV